MRNQNSPLAKALLGFGIIIAIVLLGPYVWGVIAGSEKGSSLKPNFGNHQIPRSTKNRAPLEDSEEDDNSGTDDIMFDE